MRTLLLLCSAMLLGLASRTSAQISPGPLARVHRDLEGPTNCAQCHGLHREPMSQMCLACHKDVAWLISQGRGLHAREVTDAKKDCASCHPDHAGVNFQLIAWPGGSEAGFDHRLAGWALEGKHAEAKCGDCHTAKFRVGPAAALSKRRGSAGWLGLETTCASCHREDDVHKGSLGASCERCHDTRGWKPAPKFDHGRTDYPLTGRHADVACDKCHLAPRLGIRPGPDGVRIPQFKPVAFAQCSACHDDPHRGKLSGRCSDCHVTLGWQVIDRSDFNHAVTRFPLLGKHRGVSCNACHRANLALKDPPFATCASCHADPHKGEATLAGKPADCAACHRVEGFKPATFTVAQHALTRYPLTGRHARLPCSACHVKVGATVRLRLPFAHCADCHADAHGDQLADRPDKGSCEACHTDAGWKPSTFSIAEHAKLRLPLDGRHAAIACAACHAVVRPGLPKLAMSRDALGTARVVLRVPETACADCHVDPHAGRYAKGGAFPVAGGCRSCHDARRFRPSTVDVAMHARFSFALEGAHRAVPCVACHAEMRVPEAASTLVLAPKGVASLPFTRTRSTTCRSCHEGDSPHGAQFRSRKDGGACGSCHGTDAFAPASRFDHDRDASFSLAGAHAKVACAACHKTETTVAGKARVVYRPLSGRCESCHARHGAMGRTP